MGDEVVRTGPLKWFSSDATEDEGPAGWRLDVVTLLAVIGESSIADHAQTITASMMCLLPRIIPAPQALLKPSRPLRLPEFQAKMTGVYSGIHFDSVGFFATILHPLDEMAPFSFKVLRITHADATNSIKAADVRSSQSNGGASRGALLGKLWRFRHGKREGSRSSSLPPDDLGESGRPARSTGVSARTDAERAPQQGIMRRTTMKDKVQDFMASPPTATANQKRPAIPPSLYSPTHVLSVFSLLVTVGIIIAAGFWNDGTAIIAVSLVSLASSVVGWASWWRPLLMNRTNTGKVPDGDVLIRTREGGFLLVKCSEDVARELYAGTEECNYRVGERMYQMLMGTGTLMLMVSVILLGNCKWRSQIFIGVAYIFLNALYWCMSLLPKRYFWDLSRYDVEDITPEDAKSAHKRVEGESDPERVPSFTRTLWYAIRETKRTTWVEKNGAAPHTDQWREWLDEAEDEANKIAEEGPAVKPWPAVTRKNEIMSTAKDRSHRPRGGGSGGGGGNNNRDFDEAENKAPATEVQLPAHA